MCRQNCFSADIAKVPPDGYSLPARDIAIFIFVHYNGDFLLELRNVSVGPVSGPLHVRVFRVTFSRCRCAFKLSTCR